MFVDELGERMRANYLTSAFPKFLEDHGLRRMRFHDLRHSCASLLLANGVPLKHIQEWLGHSDFTTTANIYAHLDYKSKITSAQAKQKQDEQARQDSRKEASKAIFDADTLTTELAELLIDRVLVYPDKRIEIAYKIQDIFD